METFKNANSPAVASFLFGEQPPQELSNILALALHQLGIEPEQLLAFAQLLQANTHLQTSSTAPSQPLTKTKQRSEYAWGTDFKVLWIKDLGGKIPIQNDLENILQDLKGEAITLSYYTLVFQNQLGLWDGISLIEPNSFDVISLHASDYLQAYTQLILLKQHYHAHTLPRTTSPQKMELAYAV